MPFHPDLQWDGMQLLKIQFGVTEEELDRASDRDIGRLLVPLANHMKVVSNKSRKALRKAVEALRKENSDSSS